MSRGELLARCSAAEIAEWMAFSSLNAKEQAEAQQRAQLEQAVWQDMHRRH